MIRYALVCGADHGFEAWFRDSLAFDDLSRGGNLSCPRCGSAEVRKALMAPAITGRSRPTEVAEVATSEPSAPVPSGPILEDDASRTLRTLLRDMHLKVKATAQNVGAAFPDEARKIHQGDEPKRPIYGTATSEEVRDLIEDGIAILPLPPLPEEHN